MTRRLKLEQEARELVQVFQSSNEIALKIQDSQMLAHVSKELNPFDVELMQGHLLQGCENAVVCSARYRKQLLSSRCIIVRQGGRDSAIPCGQGLQ